MPNQKNDPKRFSEIELNRLIWCVNELQCRLTSEIRGGGRPSWVAQAEADLERAKQAQESLCPTRKSCSVCRELKPFKDFYTQRKYGRIYLQSHCITCKKKNRKEERMRLRTKPIVINPTASEATE